MEVAQLRRVRPAREAGDRVELAKQSGDHLIGIVLGTEFLELIDDARQGFVGVRDRALRRGLLALRREALTVFGELGSIEVGVRCEGSAQTPGVADFACHATPCLGHMRDKPSVNAGLNRCQQRLELGRPPYRTVRATIRPPTHPRSIPPATSARSAPNGRNVSVVRPRPSSARALYQAFPARKIAQSSIIARIAPTPP